VGRLQVGRLQVGGLQVGRLLKANYDMAHGISLKNL